MTLVHTIHDSYGTQTKRDTRAPSRVSLFSGIKNIEAEFARTKNMIVNIVSALECLSGNFQSNIVKPSDQRLNSPYEYMCVCTFFLFWYCFKLIENLLQQRHKGKRKLFFPEKQIRKLMCENLHYVRNNTM